MNQFYRNLAIWMLIALAMVFLFNTFNTKKVEFEEVTFSTFSRNVDEGKVKEVTIKGQDYQIVDIGLRMLQPRELFRAQGFPDTYIIGDDERQGLKLTKSAQVRMCGNSVCPPMARALIGANFMHEEAWMEMEVA